MNDFEYPSDINNLKVYLLHLSNGLCDKINDINKDLQDIIGFNMVRLINGCDPIPKIIGTEHNESWCSNKYTLEIYMNERSQVKQFNDWFNNIYNQYVNIYDELNTERIANSMMLFSYISLELKNQMKLKCIEKGEIIDNSIRLFFDWISTVIRVLNYKIK